MSAWLNRLNLPLLTRLCAISLLARWSFLWLAHPHIHAVEDFNIAQHLARGDGFAYGGFENDWHLTALKAPAYPLFLAVFVMLVGESANSLWHLCNTHFLHSCRFFFGALEKV